MSFEDIPDYGDLHTLDQFVNQVKIGAFIDSDGFGELAKEDKTSGIEIKPSAIEDYNFPDWCTHILWFNK